MLFTVANWHEKPQDFWITRQAFTIMAAPPPWAILWQRNLDLFTPPARIVFGVKGGTVTQAEYTNVYRALMQQRLPAIREWQAANEDNYTILLCACPDGRFCHRHLVAKLLCWLGGTQIALSSLYVDPLQSWPQAPKAGAERYFGNGKLSCHLTCDGDVRLLHHTAEKIGLRRTWFQEYENPRFSHYDLTPAKREQALAHGALEMSIFDQATLMEVQ